MAIKQIVSNAFGVEQNDLPPETCRLFGFKKVSADMRQQVEKVMNKMIERGDLIERGNSLVLR